MNYQTEHEANSVRITERLSLLVVLIFAVIHSPCKHALRKESTIKRSVDDLELFYSQRGNSARIIGFFVITLEWILPAQAPCSKAMT